MRKSLASTTPRSAVVRQQVQLSLVPVSATDSVFAPPPTLPSNDDRTGQVSQPATTEDGLWAPESVGVAAATAWLQHKPVLTPTAASVESKRAAVSPVAPLAPPSVTTTESEAETETETETEDESVDSSSEAETESQVAAGTEEESEPDDDEETEEETETEPETASASSSEPELAARPARSAAPVARTSALHPEPIVPAVVPIPAYLASSTGATARSPTATNHVWVGPGSVPSAVAATSSGGSTAGITSPAPLESAGPGARQAPQGSAAAPSKPVSGLEPAIALTSAQSLDDRMGGMSKQEELLWQPRDLGTFDAPSPSVPTASTTSQQRSTPVTHVPDTAQAPTAPSTDRSSDQGTSASEESETSDDSEESDNSEESDASDESEDSTESNGSDGADQGRYRSEAHELPAPSVPSHPSQDQSPYLEDQEERSDGGTYP